ncbi:hypothetical protein JC2156_07450 [Weissella koreensis KCTC 3621]|uniref:alpha/beta fold hydrolase n=1 Tax=Weissella koreensis TaxID=165096 RepID=UPI0002175026|nr:alpha/beta hydrolase [Weissella koreensis]AEJ23340.1 putative hydrolase or acyltransferase of alpha/beta superfamily protein [Weissella koreensis KACC 15510]EJF33383.1 hypothetical protein JC2156_07450 [Weissella koreensis KCTC 3621]
MQRLEVQLSNVKLSYFDEGTGAVIFLLHGFPDSADVWRNIIPGLVSAGYRVIAPDLRGFGQSELKPNKDDYKIKFIMQDILELKASLNLTQPVKLVAHDWGANIGWMLISFFPDQFSSYFPISVGHPYAYALDGGFEQKKKGWYTMAFQFEEMAEKMFSQNDWAAFRIFTENNSELDTNWLPDLKRAGRFTAALNLYRANLVPSDNDSKLAPTPVPVHGLYGKNDLYLSQSQMEQSGKYTSGPFNFSLIDGGHWLQIEAPELVLNSILNFYKTL